MNSAGERVRYHALLVSFLISIVFVLASAAFQTKTVYNWEELQGIKFGLPVPFVVQDQNYNPPLPYDASFATVQEHETTVLFSWLFFDVFLVFCAFTLLSAVLLKTVLKPQQELILKWFLILGYGSLSLLLASLLLLALILVYLILTST